MTAYTNAHEPADSNHGIREESCDCACGHVGPCEEGCLPAGTDAPPEWGRWICIGGTRYRMYDTRED